MVIPWILTYVSLYFCYSYIGLFERCFYTALSFSAIANLT